MVHDLMSHKSTTILPSLFIVFMMADNETHLSCSSSSALQSLVNYGQGYPAHINYGLFRAKYLLTLVEVGSSWMVSSAFTTHLYSQNWLLYL